MLWIKEVEVVNSLDDLKSSCFIQGIIPFHDIELLDARIASAQKKIIQNSNFKKKVSLEEQKAQKGNRFLRGRQIAFLNDDFFRVIGVNDSVLDYADFCFLHDNVQEFDTRWDDFFVNGTIPT